jgi:hypothetical protein
MITLAKRALTATSFSLIAISLYLQFPLAANASYIADLKPQVALADTRTDDTTQVAIQNSAQAGGDTAAELGEKPAANSVVLYGTARKHQTNLDGSADEASANAGADKVNLQSQAPTSAEARANLFELAAKKLASGADLTSDDFRRLQIGCVGMETVRTFFQNIGQVEAVYPDSPAAEAGIKVGDKVIDHANDNAAKADPTQPLWSVKLAQAGTTQEVTLLQHKQPVTITLTRMNIEDIKDKKIRKMWENMAKNLVNKSEGTFMARSMKDLEHPERGRTQVVPDGTEAAGNDDD